MSEKKVLTEEEKKQKLLQATLKGMQKVEDLNQNLEKLRKEEEERKKAAAEAKKRLEEAEAEVAKQVNRIDLIRRFANIAPDSPEIKNKNLIDIAKDVVLKFDAEGKTDVTDKIDYIGDYAWLRETMQKLFVMNKGGTIYYFSIDKFRAAVNQKFDEIKNIEATAETLLGNEFLHYKDEQEKLREQKKTAAKEKAAAKKKNKDTIA
jgi:hypothetical protein